MTLRRGFRISPGEGVLIVEDVVTTGGSSLEVAQVVEEHGERRWVLPVWSTAGCQGRYSHFLFSGRCRCRSLSTLLGTVHCVAADFHASSREAESSNSHSNYLLMHPTRGKSKTCSRGG